jgi:O-antigen/teichoic acid export membrane protein
LSLKKNVVANFLSQGWTAVMGLAFVPIYIHYLGIEAYGLIGFFTLMQVWLTLFDVGITQTLNREMARYTAGANTLQHTRDLLRSLVLLSLTLAFIMCLTVWMASDYIAIHWINAQKLNSDEVANAIAIMGFVTALRFIEGIYKGVLLGLQKQVVLSVINAVFSTLRYAGVVGVLAWYLASIKVFFIWQAVSSIISLLMLMYAVYTTLPKLKTKVKFSKQAIGKVWKFARGVLGITFSGLLLTQIDKIILLNTVTLESYGHYILATTVVSCLALMSAPATQAVYPKMVEYVAQKKQLELVNLYHQGAQLVSIIIAPTVMMLIFFGKDIIYLWSGNMTLAINTAPILLPLSLSAFFINLVWMPHQLQLAHGWTSFSVKVNLIAVTLLLPSIFLAASQYGAVGAAWVLVLVNFCYLALGMHYMYKKLLPTEKWNWYWHDIIKQFLVSATVVGVADIVMNSFIHTNLVKLVTYVFVFSFAIFATSWFSSRIKPLILPIFHNRAI